jgi:hypothetical protein
MRGKDAGWLRHGDGTLEEVLHLGSPPAYTDPAWLSYPLCCPLPATLAVHIGVGGRARSAVWPALPGSVNHRRIPPRRNPQSTQCGFLGIPSR